MEGSKDIYSVEFTYQDLCEKIASGEKFDFSRFGDGEWACLLQSKPGGMNCDHHQYFPEMGKRLSEVLESAPDYYIGLQSLAYRQKKAEIDTYTSTYGLNWCRSDILHRENIYMRISRLFDALEKRDVLLVGPDHLKPLVDKYGWYHCEIPSKNCWLSYDEIKLNLNGIIGVKDWVVLYAASMMSNILIHSLRNRVTQVDIGSVLEPHVGVSIRTYHNKLINQMK